MAREAISLGIEGPSKKIAREHWRGSANDRRLALHLPSSKVQPLHTLLQQYTLQFKVQPLDKSGEAAHGRGGSGKTHQETKRAKTSMIYGFVSRRIDLFGVDQTCILDMHVAILCCVTWERGQCCSWDCVDWRVSRRCTYILSDQSCQ